MCTRQVYWLPMTRNLMPMYAAYALQHTQDCNTLQRTLAHCPGALARSLSHTATHCNTLQHTAIHCDTLLHTTTLQHTATRNMLQRTTSLQHTARVHSPDLYPTLQHTATHCSTLQHTATHCNTLQHTAIHDYTAPHCTTLQHTATHCNTLQHIATPYCNTSLKFARSLPPESHCDPLPP